MIIIKGDVGKWKGRASNPAVTEENQIARATTLFSRPTLILFLWLIILIVNFTLALIIYMMDMLI